MSPGVEGELPYACGGGFEGLLANVTRQCKIMTQDSSPYNSMLAMELDMRPSVVGFPTGEADTVPVYLGRWTLAVCRWILRLPD